MPVARLAGAAVRLAGTLLAGAALAAAAAAPARADFVVPLCGGNPAGPWVEGLNAGGGFYTATDACTSGGGYTFSLGSTMMPFDADYGAGIEIPSGEALTHVDLHYDTLGTSSGSLAFLHMGYDGTLLVNREMGDAFAGTELNVAVPDASSFWVNVFCSTSASTNCYFPNTNIVTAGAMTLTLHDTGRPSVQATGGSLVSAGVYGGTQTLAYSAQDGGSGVRSVTVALGATVVGTADAACQSFSLRPCPASATGVIDADTELVADGTYPVIVTAYDASGNGTPVQVGTVTVRNHSATQTLPRGRGRGARVHAKVEITWRWDARRTRLIRIRFQRLPRTARITISCSGRRCPFRTVRGSARHLRRLSRRLVGRAFAAGQRLTVTVAEPRRRPERALVRIRRDALPVVATRRKR